MVGNNHAKGPRAAEESLRPLVGLEATYRAFDAATKELERTIGVPVCIPGCGKCCAVTVPAIWRVEAQFLASWLLGQEARLNQVLSICEGWLLGRHPFLTMGGLQGNLSSEQWDRLRPEVDKLMMESPCPFLLEDKACMVHGGRALTCRAYGATRLPARFCPRPLSRMENLEVRAHIGDDTPLGGKLRRMVEEVVRRGAGKTGVRFLPTAVYELFRPSKLNGYANDGLIASAKLVTMQRNPAILFQRELNEVWRREAAIV